MNYNLKKGFSKQSFEKFPAFLRSKNRGVKLPILQNAKKGISPIVASVLLIAFSTAIAAVVGTWAMNYTGGELKDIKLCEDVNIAFLNVSYDPSSKEGSFQIQNTGPTIDRYDVYVFASGNLEEKVKEITNPLKKFEKKTISFETELENVKGVKIEIPRCFGKNFLGFIE